MQPKHLATTADFLDVEWNDGQRVRYASAWLADNAPEHRDVTNGQRLVDIVDLPEHPRIRSASIKGSRISIEWESSDTTTFAADWLAANAADAPPPPERRVHLWRHGAALDPRSDFAWCAFEDLRDPRRRLEWLIRLTQAGIAFVSDVPTTPEGILEATQAVGRIVDTNYGRVFDVRTVASPENLAYSDLGLGLHTDNPYREPVPGFQALHALVVSPDGGESLFADGFALADHLRDGDAEAFAILSSTAVPFRYRSADAELYAERPLIQLNAAGGLAAVHYNNRSIAPLHLPAERMHAFYAAYRRFAALLRDGTFQLTYRLRAGDLVVFNNQRILHGRTAFSSGRHARHLRGCYLTRDSVFDAAALLQRA